MSTQNQRCTICHRSFQVQFSYQMEERALADADRRERVEFAYFCSQRYLELSHDADGSGHVQCEACDAMFRVEFASQVIFVAGKRRYACGTECRHRVLGDTHSPSPAEVAPESEGDDQLDTIPAPAALPAVLDPERATLTPAMGARASATMLPPASESRTTSARRAATAPRVLAVFNHKGGTGKTTTSVTIAAGLAAAGHRVLLVDTDGQGNVAVSLGLKPERTLYHVLVMGLALEQAVTPIRPGLDILPSNETLAAAELYLAGRRQRDRVLAERLAPAREGYDFVIVDCSPSLSLLNQNALVFADAVLCPVACDYLSLVGVRQVLRTIKQVNKLLGHPVQLWGVLPTLFDARARICHEALDTLREHFGERCLPPVRLAIKVKEAPARGQTLLEYAPGSSAALDYQRVVDRLLDSSGDAGLMAPLARAGGVA